ncbi:MAG: hypothetical protein ACOWWM_15415 [Desulfobacterales bacterium]
MIQELPEIFFPELNISVLQNAYAVRWASLFENVPLNKIVLYRYQKKEFPHIKYIIVFEVNELDDGDYGYEKLKTACDAAFEARHSSSFQSQWKIVPELDISDNFADEVYKQRKEGHFLKEFQFIWKTPSMGWYPGIKFNEPHVVLYPLPTYEKTFEPNQDVSPTKQIILDSALPETHELYKAIKSGCKKYPETNSIDKATPRQLREIASEFYSLNTDKFKWLTKQDISELEVFSTTLGRSKDIIAQLIAKVIFRYTGVQPSNIRKLATECSTKIKKLKSKE